MKKTKLIIVVRGEYPKNPNDTFPIFQTANQMQSAGIDVFSITVSGNQWTAWGKGTREQLNKFYKLERDLVKKDEEDFKNKTGRYAVK